MGLKLIILTVIFIALLVDQKREFNEKVKLQREIITLRNELEEFKMKNHIN